MRYFISWYPDPPDSRYWEWFKIDGIMISIANLKGKSLQKAISLGLHRFTGFEGPIFLDSGAFQFSQNEFGGDQTRILELQEWLDPDLASHLDRPYVNREKINEKEKWAMLKETIENAWVTRRWSRGRSMEIVYVIQGWNRQSLQICAERMSKLQADYYGIGSLYRQSTTEIAKRVRLVRKIIGRRPKLHLFGVSLLRAKHIEELKGVAHLVDSFDSSSAARAGFVKELFDPIKAKRKHVNSFSYLQNECDCPVCKQFPYGIDAFGLMGRRRLYNRLRAIHNAWWLTKIAHSTRSNN